MEDIRIEHKWSVWSTIKELPAGRYLVHGNKDVLNELSRLTREYSDHVATRNGLYDVSQRPWAAFPHYVDNIPVFGCMVLYKQERPFDETFDPSVSLKGTAQATIHAIISGNVQFGDIACKPEQVAQVRTVVYNSGHKLSVTSTESGCRIYKRETDESEPLAQLVRAALRKLDESRDKVEFDVQSAGQVGYARVLVSTYAKMHDFNVGCSISGLRVRLFIKGDQLDEALDDLLAKWTSKGRHHSEFVSKMEQAVERYKHRVLQLSEVKPTEIEPPPPPVIDNDELM